MSYLRVEFHVFHPSPSPESGKGFLAAGFLLRRNRAIRLLPVRDFCSGAYIADAQGANHGHAVVGSQPIQVADAALRDVAPDRRKLHRLLRVGEWRPPADEPSRPCRWGHSCSIDWTTRWRTLAAAHPDHLSIPACQFLARIWQHDLPVCVWRRHRRSAGTLALPRLLSPVRYRLRSCLRTQFA